MCRASSLLLPLSSFCKSDTILVLKNSRNGSHQGFQIYDIVRLRAIVLDFWYYKRQKMTVPSGFLLFSVKWSHNPNIALAKLFNYCEVMRMGTKINHHWTLTRFWRQCDCTYMIYSLDMSLLHREWYMKSIILDLLLANGNKKIYNGLTVYFVRRKRARKRLNKVYTKQAATIT
jgi:hypothetical protein